MTIGSITNNLDKNDDFDDDFDDALMRQNDMTAWRHLHSVTRGVIIINISYINDAHHLNVIMTIANDILHSTSILSIIIGGILSDY